MSNSAEFPIYKYWPVEVTVDTVGTEFTFQDQPKLDESLIQRIRVYPPAVLSASIVTGKTPLALADLKKALFIFESRGTQIIKRIPLLEFFSIVDGTSPYQNRVPDINNWLMDWSKCSIQMLSAAGTAGTVSMGVYYDDRIKIGDPMDEQIKGYQYPQYFNRLEP